jgi:hypothetical protein
MKNLTPLIVAALALVFSFAASAADLTLLEQGRSDYQIVTPDTSSTPEVATGVQQAARLIQAAFKASGAEVPIVRESQRAADKPAIYVGATAFAVSHGVDISQLTGWAYVQKVVGPDVIIAGVDRSWPVKLDGTERKSTVLFPRLGTLKAAADFVREYAGVRFLYPDTPSKASVDALGDVDLLNCAGVECVKRPAIRVPENLDVRRVPVLESNIGYPPRGGFYEIAGRCSTPR